MTALLQQLQTGFTAYCVLLTVITWLQDHFANIPLFIFTRYPPPRAARYVITVIAMTATGATIFAGNISTLTTALAWFGGVYIAFHLIRRVLPIARTNKHGRMKT